MDPLTRSLLDLLYELRTCDLPLTVGGDFGLFLRRLHLNRTGERTLFDQLPEPRATNDLDLFLRAEVLADFERVREFAEALRRLGYQPVEEAKFLQWKRAVLIGEVAQEVKIDLLVGPLGALRKKLHVKAPRARPKRAIEVHAHCVEEAIEVEERPLAVSLDGQRTNGETFQGTVYVPSAFPYLMMKLFAFRDRKADERKDVGRHHALDLYTIVGMMTEAEYEGASRQAKVHAGNAHVATAREIVREDFGAPTGPGVLRLREHPLFRPSFQVSEFVAVLRELFVQQVS